MGSAAATLLMFPRLGDYLRSWVKVAGGRDGVWRKEMTVCFDTAFVSDSHSVLETLPIVSLLQMDWS